MTTDNAGGNVNLEDSVVPKQDDKVGYDTYKRVLDQKKSGDAKFKLMEEEFNAIKAERASAEESILAEQGKFKELLEAEQLRSQRLQDNLDTKNKQDVRRSKEDALRKELGPLRKEEYLKFADVESISMDADGNLDPESVKLVALKFKDSYSDLIEVQASGLPNGAPKEGSKGLTYAKWLDLSAKEQKERQSEVID